MGWDGITSAFKGKIFVSFFSFSASHIQKNFAEDRPFVLYLWFTVSQVTLKNWRFFDQVFEKSRKQSWNDSEVFKLYKSFILMFLQPYS